MKPLVSILIPAYNSQTWIEQTIKSALSQTWPAKEIIIVDDGSKDQTLSLARRFASKVVSVVPQANQGAAAARNTALRHCQGDYVQWLDADDLLSPDKIASQMRAVENGLGGRTLLSNPFGCFDFRPNRAKFIPSALWQDLPPVEWLIHKMAGNLYMQTATWLTSRELTEAAGPWNTSLLSDDDGEYFCRVLMASEGVRFVPEGRVYYRSSGGGSLRQIGCSARKIEAQWLSMQLYIRYLRSMEESERVRAACVTFLQNWLFIFYPNHLALADHARALARELGGSLATPRFSWKYAWIHKLFGWNLARRAQTQLPLLKSFLIRSWDRTLYNLESRH